MAAPRLTTDDYLRTLETVWPQELVYGVVREAAAAPTPSHQSVVGEIYWHVRQYVERAAEGLVFLSPIDVVLDQQAGLVVQPDVVVISEERRHLVTDRIWGAPDMVIEVLSPLPRIGKLEERLEWFARYGVRECWLLHQLAREIEVLTFENGACVSRREFSEGRHIVSGVLPGIELSADLAFR